MKVIKWVLLGVFLNILTINTVQANDSTNFKDTITWQDLGIGIDNPGEIKDWTYYGIKTAEEASIWIDALKPLGGVSYAGAARIWKQNGFSAKEVKGWVLIGAKTPERVKYWTNVGIKNAQEVEEWRDVGIPTPQQASQWIQAGISSIGEVKQWQEIGINDASRCKDWKRYVDNPKKVKEWMDASFSLNDVALQVSNGYLSPSDVVVKEEIANNNNYGQVSNNNNKEIFTPVSTENTNTDSTRDTWNIFLLVYFIVMIVTMFKGYGDNRTVIIFRDYNDLGLTFLIPASFVLIFYLFMTFGGNPTWGAGLASIVSISLFVILVKNTYEDNNNVMLPTVLSLMTKVPLGIIWILSFVTMLNPGGKTAVQRRKNRGTALVIMALLTPVLGMLVVEKEGSLFNPRDWIKGRRVGSIRNHL